MANKKTSYRFTTPVAELSHIHAVKPDMKYGPTYQVTVNNSVEEGKKLVAAMEALNPKFKDKIPHKIEGDKLTIKIKQKRYISWFDKTGKKQEIESIPTLLNPDNSPFTAEDNPWNGTTGEVAIKVELSKDNKGAEIVALRLVGIRFHEVKVGGSGGNDDPLFARRGEPGDESQEGEISQEDQDSFDDDIPF